MDQVKLVNRKFEKATFLLIFGIASKSGTFFSTRSCRFLRVHEMAPLSIKFTSEALRDAIVAVHLNKCNYRDVTSKFNVPTRAVINVIIELKAINNIRV